MIFTIEEITKREGSIVVYGRSGESPIRIGDVFTKLCKFKKQERFEEYIQPPEIIEEVSLSLKVTKIESFEQFPDVLEENVNGLLWLQGPRHLYNTEIVAVLKDKTALVG